MRASSLSWATSAQESTVSSDSSGSEFQQSWLIILRFDTWTDRIRGDHTVRVNSPTPICFDATARSTPLGEIVLLMSWPEPLSELRRYHAPLFNVEASIS